LTSFEEISEGFLTKGISKKLRFEEGRAGIRGESIVDLRVLRF
jgi:hypothetical protein